MTTAISVRKHSFRARKRIAVSGAVILLSVVLAFGASFAYADTEDTSQEAIGVTVQHYGILVTLILKETKTMNRIVTLFSPSDTRSPYYALYVAENGPANVIRIVMVGFGMALVLLMGGLRLIRMLDRNENSVESIMKTFALTMLGMFAVIYVNDLVDTLSRLGLNALAQMGREGLGGEESLQRLDDLVRVAESVPERLGSTNWDKLSKYAFNGSTEAFQRQLWENVSWPASEGLTYIVGRIAIIISFYSILVTAYGLLFELVLRKAFMPLAVASLVLEGARSAFSRYLRKFLAMFVRIMMLFLTIELLTFIQIYAESGVSFDVSYTVHTVMGPFGVCICGRLAGKALMSSSGQLANDIIGGR